MAAAAAAGQKGDFVDRNVPGIPSNGSALSYLGSHTAAVTPAPKSSGLTEGWKAGIAEVAPLGASSWPFQQQPAPAGGMPAYGAAAAAAGSHRHQLGRATAASTPVAARIISAAVPWASTAAVLAFNNRAAAAVGGGNGMPQPRNQKAQPLGQEVDSAAKVSRYDAAAQLAAARHARAS